MTQIEVDNPKGLREVFTNNADRISMVLKQKVYNTVPSDTQFYSIIGGMSGLHLIEAIKPTRLTLVDINPVQVEIAKGFISLLRDEQDYLMFWKRYYCRDFGKDIRQLVYTLPDPDWNYYAGFAEVPTVAARLKHAVATDTLPGKYSVRDGTKHDYFFTYGYIKCLELAGGMYRYHAITSNPAYPTCGVHFIYDGHGWHRPEGYAFLRNWLLDHEVEFICGDIYEQEFEANSYLYLTNLPGILREQNTSFCKKNKDRLEWDLFVAGDNYRETRDGRI